MKKNRLLSLVGAVSVLVFSGCPIRAQEVSLDEMVQQMTKARNEGNADVYLPLCEKVIAHPDVSASIRAAAKLNRVDGLAALKTSPETVAEEFARLEADSDFSSGFWPIELKLDAAQYLCLHDGFEEKGLKTAEAGIALVKKTMEASAQKPDNYLWDRMFLILGAKVQGLSRLDLPKDAALAVYNAFKEADSAGVALNSNHIPAQIQAAQYFLQMKEPDKYLESATLALNLVSRTKKTADMKNILEEFEAIKLFEIKVSASAPAGASMKSALLAVERIPFKDKAAAAPVIKQAKALAEKF